MAKVLAFGNRKERQRALEPWSQRNVCYVSRVVADMAGGVQDTMWRNQEIPPRLCTDRGILGSLHRSTSGDDFGYWSHRDPVLHIAGADALMF